ncbi:MAG: alpha/beta hydrolase domain-containing protein, partial [bacterium]|nr:alpha/beta hydrolase domain-containing protein [bacterium]
TIGEPRSSIAERYASKDDYLERVRQVAEQLVQERYLLDQDVNVYLAQARKFWDYFAEGKHG